MQNGVWQHRNATSARNVDLSCLFPDFLPFFSIIVYSRLFDVYMRCFLGEGQTTLFFSSVIILSCFESLTAADARQGCL